MSNNIKNGAPKATTEVNPLIEMLGIQTDIDSLNLMDEKGDSKSTILIKRVVKLRNAILNYDNTLSGPTIERVIDELKDDATSALETLYDQDQNLSTSLIPRTLSHLKNQIMTMESIGDRAVENRVLKIVKVIEGIMCNQKVDSI